jgi:hypothetical protein
MVKLSSEFRICNKLKLFRLLINLLKKFSDLSDHATFGRMLGVNIQRIKDSKHENYDGLGSVRLIKSFPVPPFEETIVAFEPNILIAYEISKGSPIKNHRGEMHFSGQGKTQSWFTAFALNLK